MAKPDGVTILITIAIVAITYLSALAIAEIDMMTLVGDRLGLIFLAIWTVAATPIAFMLPRVRAGFLSQFWRVPSSTYLVPRWVVRLCIGAMLGQVIAVLILAGLSDYRMFWLAVAYSLVGGVFCAGAWHRLKTPPRTEFTMRWWRVI